MPELLKNYITDRWVEGTGPFTTLHNPATGETLARASAGGLDLRAAFGHARDSGGAALRAMSYAERADLLRGLVGVFKARRDHYIALSIANSGTTAADSSPDVDGAIFTLNYYAKLGAGLGDGRYLLDGAAAPLDKSGAFQARHVLVPARGLALCINAFNFPAWGLWEKAAPALLSGVPVVAKPASATAMLTQVMVADAVEAGVLPPGALSLICGSGDGLLDALHGQDLLSFTGSAHTAATLRGHPAVTERSVRCNVEADSLNSMLLDPSVAEDSEHFALFAKNAVKELRIKSGQRCTAPRRLFVPEVHFDAMRDALLAQMQRITVGDPRDESVRMGSLVSRAQRDAMQRGLEQVQTEAELVHDGTQTPLIGVDAGQSACVGPSLLAVRDGTAAREAHDVEVFGPVTTLLGYRDRNTAFALIRRGGGSLVTTIHAADPGAAAACALELADSHGRLHCVTPEVAASHSGHGNVMPAALHGGPGRAGGGEELGGLRALNFYHRRCAVQAEKATVKLIDAGTQMLVN